MVIPPPDVPPPDVPPPDVPPPVIPVVVPVPEGGPGSAEFGITYTDAPEHPQ